MHLLIPYVNLYNHPDPLFDEYTYGEGGARARKLKNDVKKGDFIFFHTTIRNQKYITAYYVADRVIDTIDAINDRFIRLKYKNPHMNEMINGKIPKDSGDVIIFGDPILSKKLDTPLRFEKNLASKLSLNIKFPGNKTETQAIGSSTRAWRELTDKDANILREQIEINEKAETHEIMLRTTEEVADFVEKHLEDIVAKKPELIEESLKLEKRQLVTDDGRIDLLFEDTKGNKVVVEMKQHKIGRSTLEQIKRYIKWLKERTDKQVRGVIVCEGVMPAFEEEIKKQKDIKILCYGWQLQTQKWN
jgi:hypothetical protein